MIDLNNTYIKNDRSELMRAYISAVKEQGQYTCNLTIGDATYEYISCNSEFTCIQVSASQPKMLSEITLADLRKKQGKTVVDAVNWAEGEWNTAEHNKGVIVYIELSNSFIFAESTTNANHYLCNEEEFNQCVKEMSEFAGVSKFNWYSANPKIPLLPLEPSTIKPHTFAELLDEHSIKPRMKVEYVKVTGSDKAIASVFSSETVYYMSENSHNSGGARYSELSTIDELSVASCIYRKVETEIKTEKRYVSYDKNGKFICEDDGDSACNPDWQIFPITVEV